MPTKKNRFLKIDGFMAMMDAYVLRLRDTEMASSFWDDSHVIGGLL
jgi:phage terminase large subunit-like protein